MNRKFQIKLIALVALCSIGQVQLSFAASPYGASVWDRVAHTSPAGLQQNTTNSKQASSDGLTLEKAIQQALSKNPDLAENRWTTKIRDAQIEQAGLLPNPEIELGSEGRGTEEGATTTLQLSQRIELGGKRAKRLRVAGLDKDLTQWDYEAKRLDVITATRKAFITLVIAQERVALAREITILTQEVQRSVAQRVQAGKVSPVENTQVSVLVANASLKRQKSTQALGAAQRALCLLWGEDTPGFERADANLDAMTSIPSFDTLVNRLDQNPDLARWQTEISQRQASLLAAQSHRYSDITISGGVQRFDESDDKGLVIGVAIPIPLFDRNQGAIKQARYALSQAEVAQKSILQKSRVELLDRYDSLSNSAAEVVALRDNVLPTANNAFHASVEGYRQGKFSYLDVLEAQRTLFEARARHLSALQNYHTSVADIERLIGTNLADIAVSTSGV